MSVNSDHFSTESWVIITGETNSFSDKDARPKFIGSLETGILEGEEDINRKQSSPVGSQLNKETCYSPTSDKMASLRLASKKENQAVF